MHRDTEKKRRRFLSRLERLFYLSPVAARGIVDGFHEDIRRGLAGAGGALPMLPAFVGRPQGTEQGRFLAMDLGGTHCRVLEVELDGRRGAAVKASSRFTVPREAVRGPGKGLFDFLAGCIGAFFQEHAVAGGTPRVLAFAFSFPVEQHSLASGTLLRWTKGFTAAGVQGADVVALLSDAMERKGLGFVRVAALTNDTVGTLAAASYADPSCDMGVILGTGTNACYPERADRIGKAVGPGPAVERIVNLEWGNFDRLQATPYDVRLDAASPNAGQQKLEKMVSGRYLGEIVRLVLREMRNEGLLFAETDRAAFSTPDGLTTKALFLAARGRHDLFASAGIRDVSETERAAVCEIGRIVATRSARIAGAAIAAVATWMDPPLERDHTVAIDGSLFEKNPAYQAWMAGILDELFNDRAARIRPVLAKDGSGIGAAIVGAMASLAGPAGGRADAG